MTTTDPARARHHPRCQRVSRALCALLLLASCRQRVVVGHEPSFTASNAAISDAGPDADGDAQQDDEMEVEMSIDEMDDGEDVDANDSQMTDSN